MQGCGAGGQVQGLKCRIDVWALAAKMGAGNGARVSLFAAGACAEQLPEHFCQDQGID